MSITIQGMSMPESGEFSHVRIYGNGEVTVEDSEGYETVIGTATGSEHEFIERKAVIDKLTEYGIGWGTAKVVGVINSIPAAYVRPAGKAEWLELEDCMCICSNCMSLGCGTPYCPESGSKMEVKT